jgi:hypothetical protein
VGDYFLTGSAGNVTFTASHAAYAKGVSLTGTGKYTVLLSATDSSNTVPQGTGYATMTVAKTGGVTMAGKLADGTAFSTSAVLLGGSAGNQCVIYDTLTYPSVTTKGAKGLLIGNLTFDSIPGSSDLNGTLEWVKPQQSKGAYQAAIDTSLNVIGSAYTAPARGGSVLPGFTSGTLTLSDSAALVLPASALIKTGTLTSVNAFLITNSGTDNTKVTITPSTGVFSGSFLYPGQTKTTAFGGVLFQDGTNGAGFFLGPNGSGNVELTPQ